MKIEEIEAHVLDVLLHFIYNDSFSGFEEIHGNKRKQETESMARHLLVAADRYVRFGEAQNNIREDLIR